MKSFYDMKWLRYVALACGLTLAAPAQAAGSLQDVVDSIQSLQKGMLNWVNAVVTMYMDMLYEENPSYPITVASNMAEAEAPIKTQETLTNLALPQIREALTRENEDRRAIILSAITASDSFETNKATQGKKVGKGPAAGDANFNLGSLLATDAYKDEDAKKQALGFIEFITSLVDPISGLRLDKLSEKQRLALQDTAAGREYIRNVRALVAARSMAVDNLLQIYAQRLPQTGLGKAAGMAEADASPQEVKRYIASRRADNQDNWYQTMATASTSTISRETLHVLAEIERQNYQTQVQNEQILATLSLIALQNMKASRAMDQAKEMAATNAISGK